MQAEDIRTVMIDGEKWYVGKDVASVLGYKDAGSPLKYRFDSTDKKKHKILINNKKHDIIIINKHGLESLVSRSSKPNAISVAKKLGIKVNKMWPKPKKVEGIRTVMIDGEKWYVGRDVASVLGYVQIKKTVRNRVNSRYKRKYEMLTNGGKQPCIIINNNGLEQLISSSKMPNAISIAKKLGISINVHRVLHIYKQQKNIKKAKKKGMAQVKDIRTVVLNGELWYVGTDVAKFLGYTKADNEVRRKVDSRDKLRYKLNASTGKRICIIINQHGLESFLYHSSKPNVPIVAKKLNVNLNYMSDTYKEQDIRNIIIDGKQWFVAIDVATILGYSSAESAVYNNVNKENKMRGCVKSEKQNQSMTIINKNGVEELISRSTLPNAIDIAKKLGIRVNHILNTRKEQDSIHAILKTFKGENMVRQYRVGTYYIDLYFPDYKLAIECDEHGHSDRDQDYEKTRQHYIEDNLGCKFIRYNPDSKNYNIFNVLNRIYKEISKN